MPTHRYIPKKGDIVLVNCPNHGEHIGRVGYVFPEPHCFILEGGRGFCWDDTSITITQLVEAK